MLSKSVFNVQGGCSSEQSVALRNKMFVRFLVALALFSLVSSSAVPLTKCKADDSDCIKENSKVLIPLFAAGIPELGIEQLDPVIFKKIDSSSGLLKLIFRNATLSGLKTCRFKSLNRDPVKKVLSARIHCDVIMDGQYEMSGELFSLRIQGNGKMHIEHKKVEINFELKYDEVTGADGKKHWSTGEWTHDYTYKGKTTMEFDNLFDGNEILGRVGRDLIKNNGNEIAAATAGPVIKVITAKILKNVKIFFEKVPVEDFALD